jgi:hypothetical protein
MVLRSQQNCGDFMTKLQESGLINGYLDNPNPAKRPKLVLDKKKNEEEANDSMDEDEINQILSAQLSTLVSLYLGLPKFPKNFLDA